MRFQAEEKTLIAIGAETTRLGGALFRSQQMLVNWQSEHKVLEVPPDNICISQLEPTVPIYSNFRCKSRT